MRYALREAEKAYDSGEVPVGAIIVREETILGKGFNQREALQDPTAHAEILAITAASAAIKSWRLDDCILYVTLEPCPMCAGAILNARIKQVVFGAEDVDSGVCVSRFKLCNANLLNHNSEILGGILASESRQLLNQFFQTVRKEKKR
jgi:tRNA(adenine34) deaminase